MRVPRAGPAEDRAHGVLGVGVHGDPADRQLARLGAALLALARAGERPALLVQAQRGVEGVQRRADRRGLAEQHLVAPRRVVRADRLVARVPQAPVALGRHVHRAAAADARLRVEIVLEVGLVPHRVERHLAAVALGHGRHELAEQIRPRLPVALLAQRLVAADLVRDRSSGFSDAQCGNRRRHREEDLQARSPARCSRSGRTRSSRSRASWGRWDRSRPASACPWGPATPWTSSRRRAPCRRPGSGPRPSRSRRSWTCRSPAAWRRPAGSRSGSARPTPPPGWRAAPG